MENAFTFATSRGPVDVWSDISLIRLGTVLKIYPVSKSTWWDGVRTARYPQPYRLSARAVAWRLSDIRALVEQAAVRDHA